MQKLELQTPNRREENIQKLAQIFPQVVKEDKVDFDLLKQLLSDAVVEGCKERYGLNWVGKRASIFKANTPIRKTLRPVLEKSVDFEKTKNLYIEGDNFEALKIIQESYLGKIKMIYIDPPYNTGKDFIYKDSFKQSKEEYDKKVEAVDEEGVKLFKNTDSNGRFHSDWLSMMYERLLVARDLLQEDGVIFISIDDNEVHNLRHLCDEVFGEGNFVTQLIWKKKSGGGSDSKYFAVDHEYIIIYGKNIESIANKFMINMSDKQKNEFKYKDSNFKLLGPYKRKNLFQTGIETDRPNLRYKITAPDGTNILPPTIWRWSKKKFLDNFNSGKIDFIKDKEGKWQVYTKIYLYENGSERLIKPRTILDKCGYTKDGNKDIKILFKKEVFNYPKPVKLVEFLIKTLTKNDKNGIVLDFFSGSATTAHAVMQLNAEDGGNRQFIMVQIPEKVDEKSEAYKAGFRTIAEIGRERIIRAAKKIKDEFKDKEYIDDLDFGFRYFKVDSSNFKEAKDISEITQENLPDTVENIKPDRNDLDLLFAVILALGLELILQIESKEIAGKKVYFVEHNSLIACFDEEIDETLAAELVKYNPLKVVLKDSSFKSDDDKINFEQTFKELSPETDIWVV